MSRAIWAALCAIWFLGAQPAAAAAPGAHDAAGASSYVVRLHIVANSNSPDDIAAKIAVRDALLGYLDSRLAAPRSPADEMQAIESMIPAMSRIARQTLQGYGVDYPASVRLGTAVMPTRGFLGLRLGAGRYATVLVVLGKGQGQNWWCTLFPQVCLSDGGAAVGYREHRAKPPSAFEALPLHLRPQIPSEPVVRPGGLLWNFWRHFRQQHVH